MAKGKGRWTSFGWGRLAAEQRADRKQRRKFPKQTATSDLAEHRKGPPPERPEMSRYRARMEKARLAGRTGLKPV
jgi:hypothetical protein